MRRRLDILSIVSILTVSIAVSSYAGIKKVQVSLDYRQQRTWHYKLNYHSDCIIVDLDSSSRIRTDVNCMLAAAPSAKGDRLTFRVDSVSVFSEFYNQDKQQSIADKLTGGEFGVALIGGCPVVDTLTSFSISEISEWDLVIQFAKLLPDVPVRQVRKGYQWENSGVFPIMSNMGKVDCEVFRIYTIDSISKGESSAHISWQFRYAAINTSGHQSRAKEKVPVSGKGTGSAVIDVLGKRLLKAGVNFVTPVATYGSTKVSWEERTSLELVPNIPPAPVAK